MKCATFRDHNQLPDHIRRQMKEDRARAEHPECLKCGEPWDRCGCLNMPCTTVPVTANLEAELVATSEKQGDTTVIDLTPTPMVVIIELDGDQLHELTEALELLRPDEGYSMPLYNGDELRFRRKP